jgi:hypothetical protein
MSAAVSGEAAMPAAAISIAAAIVRANLIRR